MTESAGRQWIGGNHRDHKATAEIKPQIGMETNMASIEIRVKGCLDEHWSEWFNEFEIAHTEAAETVLTGKVHDQSALYGILTRLRDLGLSLVEVKISESSGDT